MADFVLVVLEGARAARAVAASGGRGVHDPISDPAPIRSSGAPVYSCGVWGGARVMHERTGAVRIPRRGTD